LVVETIARIRREHFIKGKPSPRHASLAVNTAGAIATFLVETYLKKKPKS
jgi:hypothetical protein